ncbi:MAG: polysaccharide deacetylase family protein [Polyangiales bacterium]
MAALSIDLDGIACYCAIHGLPDPPPQLKHAIYRRAVPRFAAFLRAEAVPATFFVIARDLDDADNCRTLRALLDQGHEVGNHSLDHFYDLSRRSPAEQAAQIGGAAARIEAALGQAPQGFRAPGYVTTDQMLQQVAQAGMRYDSSLFPCPAYYAAKALVIAGMRARGRPSASLVDDPRMLLAPAQPYRMAQPYWRPAAAGGKPSSAAALVQIPMGVTPLVRLPFIGTNVLSLGPKLARLWTHAMCHRPFVHLEMHGIDLADAGRDGLEFLRPYQADLRCPLERKQAALRAVIHTLKARDYRFVTLRQMVASD